MRYISVFSGIEAASVAWEPLGWEPLAFCEIDKFPSAVLAHRFPDVENLGDITKVDWKEVIARHGRPDVVVGGSPCQSFSVAGGRESLSGESRLMFEYVRALDEIRPRWFLWENVPGVLNTRDNAFAQLLGEVQKLGYGSLAWRVLDAQFFGVAQRRRRVFLVGRLGEGGRAAAVLFESESVRGDNPSSREKRKALARAAGRGPACGGFKYHQGAKAGGLGNQPEQSPTLTADYHNPAVAFVQNIRNEVRLQGGDGSVTGPIAASDSAKGQGVPFVMATGQGKYVIRRLMPVEAERLQGFPDGWTDVPYKGKEHPSDTPRYKAIGNSMAVPVMRWIGRRMQMVDQATTGSDPGNGQQRLDI